MSKNLTFKLILDGDSKGLVSAAKQSEDAARKALDAIKNGTADIVGSTGNATKSMDSFGDQTAQTAKQVQGLDDELDQTNQSLRGSQSAAQAAEKGISGLKTGYSLLASAVATVGIGLSIRELAEAADSYSNLSTRIQIATREHGNFTKAIAGVHQIALSTNSSLDATATLFTRLNTVGKDMGMTQQQALDLTKTITQAIQVSGGSAQQSEAAITQFIQAMQGGVLRGEEFNSIMENGYGLAEALAKGLGVTTGELRGMAEAGELSAERVVKAIGSQSAEIEKLYGQFPTTIGNALQRIATSWQILIGEMDQANGASATVAQWLVTLADNMGVVETLLNDIGEGFVWVGDQLKKIDPATIEALKEALATAYESVKDLGRTLGDSFERGVDIINTVLGTIFDFDSGVDAATDKTNGFTKALQALNVVFGFIGDGFKAINIVANLLTGVFYDVAAAWQNFKSKFTWGDTKTAIIAEMNAMAEKAQEYYTKASNGAMDFKSKGVEAIQEISKTQTEKNAESVADAKATMDQLLAEQSREVEGKKATESEKLAAVQAYAEAAIAANKGVIDGTMQADLINKGYIVTVDEVGKVSVEAWKKGEEAAKGSADSITLARKAADGLKLDLFEMKNGYTEAFGKGRDQVQQFAKEVESLGFKGEKAGEAIYQAWLKWLLTAKSSGEVELAEKALENFGKTGQLSTSQVEQGMLAIRSVVGKLPADLSPVEEAFERLGIKTKEQLRLAAQSALADFNTIQASGQATAEGIRQAYERAMQAAAASGDQAVIAATQAKAASLGLQVEIDSAGKATVKSMNEAEDAIHRVRNATGHAGAGFDELGRRGVSSANATRDAWEEARQAAAAAADASNSITERGLAGRKSTEVYTLEGVKQALKAKGYTDESQINRLANELYNADAQTRKNALMQYQYEAGKNIPGFALDFKAVNMMAANNKDYIDLMLQKMSPSTGSSSSYAPSIPSTPSVRDFDSTPKTTIRIEGNNGQSVNAQVNTDQVDPLTQILKQLGTIKKSS